LVSKFLREHFFPGVARSFFKLRSRSVDSIRIGFRYRKIKDVWPIVHDFNHTSGNVSI